MPAAKDPSWTSIIPAPADGVVEKLPVEVPLAVVVEAPPVLDGVGVVLEPKKKLLMQLLWHIA